MKRKKKPNTQQAMRHLAAQYRADFFRKMNLIIDSVCGKDIYPLIPQSIIEDAYLCRCAPFKFRADENSNISTKHLKDAKVILSALIKDHFVQLPPHKLEISLCEYFTVYFTIMVMRTRTSDTCFSNAPKVKEALRPFSEDTATFVEANNYLYSVFNAYIMGVSDLSKILYWYKHDFRPPQSYPNENET